MLILALCILVAFLGFYFLRTMGVSIEAGAIGFWDNVISMIIGGLFGWAGARSKD